MRIKNTYTDAQDGNQTAAVSSQSQILAGDEGNFDS
jgi:hypothetical protein